MHRLRSARAALARRLVLGFALLALSNGAFAQACPAGVCGTVEVTGTGVDGRQIICNGPACANILDYLRSLAIFEMDYIPVDIGDVPVDRNALCSALASSKPADCGSTPPPSPGINMTPSTFLLNHTNGCGDGSWRTSVLSGLGYLFLEAYSGDPNTPIVGSTVSFRNACNAHDMCYAGGEIRATCDQVFGDNLVEVCEGSFSAGSQGHGTCMSFASTYLDAVQTGGGPPYQNAANERACAIWHKDMETNECPL